MTIDEIKERIAKGAYVRILSGDGDMGTIKDYTGRRSLASVLKRLREERCGRDRFARVYFCDWFSRYGSCWIDIETGEVRDLGAPI